MTSEHRVCDYEGSPYRRVFWEEADRAYEDATERLAVREIVRVIQQRAASQKWLPVRWF